MLYLRIHNPFAIEILRLPFHVEFHYALEEILPFLGRLHLAHHTIEELSLMIDNKFVALDNCGAYVEGTELGPDVAYL